MKKIIIIICFVAAIFQISCSREDNLDVDFQPRIFDNGNMFTSPTRVITEGQTVKFSNISFSPSTTKGLTLAWKINDKQVSDDTVFTFTPPDGGGEFMVTLEASYNGLLSTRSTNILVSPTQYTLKPYNQVALSYLTENGNAKNIDWKQVTHVAYNTALVRSDGTVDFSKGDLNQIADELVARAHINGIPLLLGISGRLSPVDGWSLYNSSDFGDAISSPSIRTAVIKNIVDYVNAKNMDGVDILMTDLSNDNYSIAARNAAAVGPFITALKAALKPNALVTATVTTNYLHWEYSSLSDADWIHVRAFEDGLHVGPEAPLGQPSSFDYFKSAATIWLDKGYPANKLVLGIPAFGLRYDQLDEKGNNLDWGSYTYVPYAAILQASSDQEAYQKEYLANIGAGIYYNGTALVMQKAKYINAQDFKGAYLWAGDYDVTDTRSLMTTLKSNIK